VIEGGPHGIAWTHTEIVNHELLEFLGQAKSALKSTAAHGLSIISPVNRRPRRHDADQGRGDAVEHKSLADDRGVKADA
jgi:hypothetical protein